MGFPDIHMGLICPAHLYTVLPSTLYCKVAEKLICSSGLLAAISKNSIRVLYQKSLQAQDRYNDGSSATACPKFNMMSLPILRLKIRCSLGKL